VTNSAVGDYSPGGVDSRRWAEGFVGREILKICFFLKKKKKEVPRGHKSRTNVGCKGAV